MNILKKIIYLILFLFSFQFGNAQQISETERLATLGKIWGFLKYYHPEVAVGKYNWDEQFIGILPEIRKAENSEQLSQVYLTWLDRLGTVKPCKKCNPDPDKEYFDKNFDLSWTRDSTLFTKELSSRLKYIEDNRFQGKPYYISTYNPGQIEVINEPKYENFEYPNEEYRLLALVKYWNIIEYFFPYKYMTDQDWDDVLTEMIPKFTNAKDTTEYHLAMLELVTKIDDTHAYLKSNIIDEHFGQKRLNIKFKIIDNLAVITGFYSDSLAKVNDLKIGDIVTQFNEKSVSAILSENYKYIPASNKVSKLRFSQYLIFKSRTDSLKIRILRDKLERNKTIAAYDYDALNQTQKSESVKWKILGGNVGYINTSALMGKDNINALKELKNCKAIIVDFRGVTGNTGIVTQLNDEKRVFAKLLSPDITYPGRYYWTESLTNKSNNNYKGKIIVLVNEATFSQGEYLVMALQAADNVVTIGSQTTGADGNVSKFDFMGGFETHMSGIGVYYPDKTPAQRRGVKIDIEVNPTIQGIGDGRDEVLERALEFIEENR